MDNFSCNKDDAQSDTGLDRLLRNMHKPECRAREGDAMCNCKGSHSSYKATSTFHQNHQGKDKQQMINSGPNVFDAEAEIRTGNVELRQRAGYREHALLMIGDNGACPRIKRVESHDDVGDRSLKTAELDPFSGQPIRSRVDPSPFEDRIRQFLLDRRLQVLYIARHG